MLILESKTLFLYHIYPTPPLGQDMTQGQFLSAEFKFWTSLWAFHIMLMLLGKAWIYEFSLPPKGKIVG